MVEQIDQLIDNVKTFVLRYKLYHLFFWAIYLISAALILPVSNNIGITVIKQLPIFVLHAIVVYVNFNILIPRFLLVRNYLYYVVGVVLLVFSVTFPIAIIIHTIIENHEFQSMVWSPIFLYLLALSVLFSVILTMLLKFLKQWYEDQRISRELTKVQLETELKFLKAQINPHFLFNSLNNLYALTLKKSDLAPEVVLRLSDILRYVLYDTNLGSVDIQKELSHLRDFIELEKIRLGDRVKITVDLVEPPVDMNIEPMLYLTLLENAFKHGSNGLTDEAWVSVHGFPTLDGYSMKIENSITKGIVKLNSDIGGIGLENLKKRLTLTYGDNFNLKINHLEDSYSVLLDIKLINK